MAHSAIESNEQHIMIWDQFDSKEMYIRIKNELNEKWRLNRKVWINLENIYEFLINYLFLILKIFEFFCLFRKYFIIKVNASLIFCFSR